MVRERTGLVGRAAGRLLPALALGLGLGAAAMPGAASAQFFGGWSGWDNGGAWDGLPGPQVRRAIMAQGFRVLGPLRRNGSVFVADVIDRRGRRERLVVAAADAQILQRFYVDDGRGAGAYARRDEGGDEFDRGGPVPPADIPGVRRRLEPVARQSPNGRDGTFGGEADAPVVVPRPAPPPIRTVKPRIRDVEREVPGREPGPVEATPLAPAPPRARAAEPPKPPAVAARPAPAPAAPPAPAQATAVPAAPPKRLTDPLAIPGPRPADVPVRSVSGAVTGAPAPVKPAPAPAAAPAKPAEAPAKAADVPAAPLD